MTEPVAVIGTGQTVFRSVDRDRTFPEQAQAAAKGALDDAGLTPDDIEAIVFSLAPTAFMGVAEADRWAVDHIWGSGKPMMRVHTGGATGGSVVHAGYSLIRSGMFRTVLLVGAERMAETPDVQYFLNQIWDPFYERDLALQTIVMGAFLGQQHMHLHGTTEEDFARVVVRQRRNALKNPHAHLKGEITVEDVMRSPRISYPIKLFDMCPRSSGGAAMILSDLDTAKQRCGRPAFINGLGAVSNTVFLGDRISAYPDRIGPMIEHEIAAQKAYKGAGITDPSREIQVAEIYDPFSTMLYPALEYMDFCRKGTAANLEKEGAWELGSMVSVNPSGGTLCTNPIAVTGLVRNIEAARQVMGRAEAMQVPNVKHALATAAGGSGQFINVTVYGQDHR
jgi:acetyl-CoA C-acetyltransferase